MGTKLLGFSIGRGSGALKGLNPLCSWNPFWGTKLLGISIGRGLGALNGLTAVSVASVAVRGCLTFLCVFSTMLTNP